MWCGLGEGVVRGSRWRLLEKEVLKKQGVSNLAGWMHTVCVAIFFLPNGRVSSLFCSCTIALHCQHCCGGLGSWGDFGEEMPTCF